MTNARQQKTPYFSLSLLVLILTAGLVSPVLADGVFLTRNKQQHKLSDVELNRIKAEHQIRFGKSAGQSAAFNTNNPWEKKKKKSVPDNSGSASWGECREYALQKRNLCYREGRDAYHCEQVYEARTRLCDSTL